jgi:ABC-type nitrate/sulfonate/bicarbonate transport system substrate-binding protein
VCAEALGLRPGGMTVEFTQHPGDEAFREVFVNGAFHVGFAPDWTPALKRA